MLNLIYVICLIFYCAFLFNNNKQTNKWNMKIGKRNLKDCCNVFKIQISFVSLHIVLPFTFKFFLDMFAALRSSIAKSFLTQNKHRKQRIYTVNVPTCQNLNQCITCHNRDFQHCQKELIVIIYNWSFWTAVIMYFLLKIGKSIKVKKIDLLFETETLDLDWETDPTNLLTLPQSLRNQKIRYSRWQ